jgi:hypothetical protein
MYQNAAFPQTCQGARWKMVKFQKIIVLFPVVGSPKPKGQKLVSSENEHFSTGSTRLQKWPGEGLQRLQDMALGC